MFTGFINTFSFTLPPSAGDIWYAASAAAAPVVLLMFASFVYSISQKSKKIANTGTYALVSIPIAQPTTSSVQRSEDEDIFFTAATDLVSIDETMLEDDARYAEELQVQEALLASMFETTHNASSSTHKLARPSLSSFLKNNKKEKQVCKICLEKHEYCEMFRNSTCCHSFCIDCTSKHAATKIQGKNTTITCPGIGCKSTLDFNSLRLIIPKETLIKWDELLCESMIHESQKLYCPFANCSVLLINDDNTRSITKIDCPVCRRSFCAVCKVPWHSEFSCKEFGKLNMKKKGTKGDEMAVALAKKKKWKKCPSCKYFVEKTEGCVHITCRCKYEFCYDCGAKWSSTHGGCRPRS